MLNYKNILYTNRKYKWITINESAIYMLHNLLSSKRYGTKKPGLTNKLLFLE